MNEFIRIISAACRKLSVSKGTSPQSVNHDGLSPTFTVVGSNPLFRSQSETLTNVFPLDFSQLCKNILTNNNLFVCT